MRCKMKKFFIVFALLAIFFIISCGGGSSNNDGNTDRPGSVDMPDGDHTYLTLGNICTGQRGCYSYDPNMVKYDNEIPCPDSASDDFYGQDAQYLDKCTAQSFKATSKVVVDNNTGLIWERSASTENYTWEDRATHCNKLNASNFGGISTWRLPNPLEFITIVDISNKYEPATNSNFTGMPSSESIHLYLWTNSECKAFEDDMVFGFKPAYGDNRNIHTKNGGGRPETYKVLCVSGNELLPAASDDFTISSDGKTVTDNRTGLMWQKEHVTGKTWKQALAYCQSLNTQEPPYAGYSDWRLPNKNELASLINYERTELPFTYFPDESSNGYFWTSSTPAYNTNLAWDVDFRFGDLSSGVKLYEEYVRCVR